MRKGASARPSSSSSPRTCTWRSTSPAAAHSWETPTSLPWPSAPVGRGACGRTPRHSPAAPRWPSERRTPLDLMAAALLALCAPPAMEALGGVWNLVALVGDVQRHKSELTRFSIAETMNTVPVGALVVDAGGRSLLLNDSMRALLRDLGLPTDLGDLRGTWDGIARSARPARLSRGARRRPWPARRHRCAQRARAPPQEDRRARDRPSR